jgi:hypothetical protein
MFISYGRYNIYLRNILYHEASDNQFNEGRIVYVAMSATGMCS